MRASPSTVGFNPRLRVWCPIGFVGARHCLALSLSTLPGQDAACRGGLHARPNPCFSPTPSGMKAALLVYGVAVPLRSRFNLHLPLPKPEHMCYNRVMTFSREALTMPILPPSPVSPPRFPFPRLPWFFSGPPSPNP